MNIINGHLVRQAMKETMHRNKAYSFSPKFPGGVRCFIGLAIPLFGLLSAPVAAQKVKTENEIEQIIARSDSLRSGFPREKIYLQLDKAQYSVGDTIWFKAYLMEAAYGTFSTLSGILYVELIDPKDSVLKRLRLPVVHGLSWGDIVLDNKETKDGPYILRAYTNWMQNFGTDHFFHKAILITGPAKEQWIVNSSLPARFEGDRKDSIQMVLKLRRPEGNPIADKPIQLKITAGKRTLLTHTIPTDEAGSLDINFTLPASQRERELSLHMGADGKEKAVLPLRFAISENVDIQFMPEGGQWVAGLPIRLGVKAVGIDGKGVNVAGTILNDQQQEITRFSTTYKGMGTVSLPPLPVGRYTARVYLSDGHVKTYPLPEPIASGTVLEVFNDPQSDSLQIVLGATADLLHGSTYLLTGEARGTTLFIASLRFSSHNIKTSVSKQIFPSGIAHFTLQDKEQVPLNERICFIDHRRALTLTVEPDKPFYNTRDSVVLQISAKDAQGKPVEGNFSMAITDDAQVDIDAGQGTILSSFLLSSDLKGVVETPGYYFIGQDTARKALDALMLTQGWVRYDQSLLGSLKTKPLYRAEPVFTISGRVSNAFNKPVENANVVLFSSGKISIISDTVTNKSGEFIFQHFPYFDTAVFLIQARNRRGRSFNVGIDVDEFKPAPVPPRVVWPETPWYVNTDSTLNRYVVDQLIFHDEMAKLSHGGRMLAEVTVTSTRIIKGSHNLNGAGNTDQVIDQDELDKQGKKTLQEVLEEKVEGFHTGYFPPKNGKLSFMIKEKQVRLVFDGVDVDFFYTPFSNQNDERYQYIKSYLQHYTAEDVTGIEVMYNSRYNSAYNSRFLPGGLMDVNPVMGPDYAYLEITTRSGSGPFMKKTPGMYLYKPLPFYWPRKFYAPRYSLKETDSGFTDLRSTVHWEPNIITDSTGKAKVTFFTADRPGTYTVIVEGGDMNGGLGVKRSKLIIHHKE